MSQKRTQSTRQNFIYKHIDQIRTWWRQANVHSQTTDPQQLRSILSDSFACFAIGLFLFYLYLTEPSISTMLLVTSGISLVFAIILLLAVFVVDHCPAFYSCAKWFEDQFIVIWIFMLTQVSALVRIIDVIQTAAQTNQIFIPIVLAVSGAYFIAYLTAIFWRTAKLKKPRPIQNLQNMTRSLLIFILLLMLSNKIWPTIVRVESWWNYILILLIAIIPLSIAVKKEPKKQQVLMLSTLTITGVVIILLLVGTLHTMCHLWFWFCWALLLIATILLCIGMTRENRALQKHNKLRLRS